MRAAREGTNEDRFSARLGPNVKGLGGGHPLGVAERRGLSPSLFSLARGNLLPGHSCGLGATAGGRAPFTLCGLSLGAVLALDYALRNRERVASLVLVGVQFKMPRLLMAFQDGVFRLLPGKAFAGMGLDKPDALRLTRSMRSLDFTEKIPSLSCPVTIVCGQKDKANLKASQDLKALLPRARLCLLPGVGHAVNECAPEALAALLRAERA